MKDNKKNFKIFPYLAEEPACWDKNAKNAKFQRLILEGTMDRRPKKERVSCIFKFLFSRFHFHHN